MSYINLNGSSKYIQKILYKCPFCGENSNWMMKKTQGFIKNTFDFKCQQCFGTIEIKSSMLPPLKKEYKIINLGLVNKSELKLNFNYNIDELIEIGKKLALEKIKLEQKNFIINDVKLQLIDNPIEYTKNKQMEIKKLKIYGTYYYIKNLNDININDEIILIHNPNEEFPENSEFYHKNVKIGVLRKEIALDFIKKYGVNYKFIGKITEANEEKINEKIYFNLYTEIKIPNTIIL